MAPLLRGERHIVAFESDEAGDWIALLDCGHRQHVRHRPPWTNRSWVTSAAGRESRIGARLVCRHCLKFGEAVEENAT